MILLVAAIAGGLAAVVRYAVTLAFAGRGSLPWAVFTVNVVGAGLGGTIVGLSTTGVVSTDLRLVIIGGVAGGLTTFSTWSTETIQLAMAGKWGRAGVNVGMGLVAGILAATIGYLVAVHAS